MSKGRGKVGLLNSGWVKMALIFVILNLKLEGRMPRQMVGTGYIPTSI